MQVVDYFPGDILIVPYGVVLILSYVGLDAFSYQQYLALRVFNDGRIIFNIVYIHKILRPERKIIHIKYEE